MRPCRTSVVACASARARWQGVTCARKRRARVDSLQLGASSRVSTRRASLAVSRCSKAGHARPSCWQPRLEEAEVERRVVRDEHGPAAELQEGGQRLVEPGRAGDHRVGDAGQHGDERRDRAARVDQGLELTDHLAAADLDRADLGDVARQVGAAGGLEVDDDEGHLAQRPAQLVERRLVRDGERPGPAGEHGADARCALRHRRAATPRPGVRAGPAPSRRRGPPARARRRSRPRRCPGAAAGSGCGRDPASSRAGRAATGHAAAAGRRP